MGLSEGLNNVVAALVLIWGILSIYETSRLRRQVTRLQIRLDQSIQRLHLAREAVINEQKTRLFLHNYVPAMSEVDEIYATKRGEFSAYQAELRGLAFAIEDEELLRLVNKGLTPYSDVSGEQDRELMEMEIRGRAQQLRTRISQLIQEHSQ